MQRRHFLKFMSRTAVVSSLIGSEAFFSACTSATARAQSAHLPSLEPRTDDNLSLVNGLLAQVLIRWNDPINNQGDLFGYNNDFIAFLPGENIFTGYIWVNHEYVHPLFVSGYNPAADPRDLKNKQQTDIEQKNVGGSFIRIKKHNGAWTVDTESDKNFRIDGRTKIALIAEREIQNSKTAIGTLANCSGGKTPWNTILSCEENYQDFYGKVTYTKKGSSWNRELSKAIAATAWDDNYFYPPEHYGWVVEIDPAKKQAQKLTALGRFAHEGATVVSAPDGRCVVYMGDDSQNQYFYKFVAHSKNSLEIGDLYVANLQAGRWELLSVKNPMLKNEFADQTDLLIRTREAAKLVNATPLDRPEACAQDPISKSIFLNCTMNKEANRPYGSIIKFMETDNDPHSLTFTSETFLNGGDLAGFACPDNMCFDAKGNLWLTTDIGDRDLNTDRYQGFGNNGLFYLPLSGPQAGKAFRFAIAPMEAEFTGPCFSSDGKTLFLSVQHPGANTTDLSKPTSRWPDGVNSLPKPSVIAISGPLLDSLTA